MPSPYANPLYSDEELSSLYEEERNKDRGILGGGIQSGSYGLSSSIQNALAAGGRALGADEFAAERERRADELAAQASGAGYNVPQFKDISGPSEALGWATGMIGQQLPLAATMIGTGVLGGIGGAAAMGRKGLAQAIGTATGKETLDRLTREGVHNTIAANEAAKSALAAENLALSRPQLTNALREGLKGRVLGAKIGSKVGALAPYYATTTGETYGGLRTDPEAQGTLEEKSRAALLSGALQTGLGTLFEPLGLMQRMAKLRRVQSPISPVKALGISTLGEGATEAGEQAIQQYTQQQFNPQAEFDVGKLVEAGLGGALVGGAVGAPMAAIQSPAFYRGKKQPITPKELTNTIKDINSKLNEYDSVAQTTGTTPEQQEERTNLLATKATIIATNHQNLGLTEQDVKQVQQQLEDDFVNMGTAPAQNSPEFAPWIRRLASLTAADNALRTQTPYFPRIEPTTPGIVEPTAPGIAAAPEVPPTPGIVEPTAPGIAAAPEVPSTPGIVEPTAPGIVAAPEVPTVPGIVEPTAPGTPIVPPVSELTPPPSEDYDNLSSDMEYPNLTQQNEAIEGTTYDDLQSYYDLVEPEAQIPLETKEIPSFTDNFDTYRQQGQISKSPDGRTDFIVGEDAANTDEIKGKLYGVLQGSEQNFINKNLIENLVQQNTLGDYFASTENNVLQALNVDPQEFSNAIATHGSHENPVDNVIDYLQKRQADVDYFTTQRKNLPEDRREEYNTKIALAALNLGQRTALGLETKDTLSTLAATLVPKLDTKGQYNFIKEENGYTFLSDSKTQDVLAYPTNIIEGLVKDKPFTFNNEIIQAPGRLIDIVLDSLENGTQLNAANMFAAARLGVEYRTNAVERTTIQAKQRWNPETRRVETIVDEPLKKLINIRPSPLQIKFGVEGTKIISDFKSFDDAKAALIREKIHENKVLVGSMDNNLYFATPEDSMRLYKALGIDETLHTDLGLLERVGVLLKKQSGHQDTIPLDGFAQNKDNKQFFHDDTTHDGLIVRAPNVKLAQGVSLRSKTDPTTGEITYETNKGMVRSLLQGVNYVVRNGKIVLRGIKEGQVELPSINTSLQLGKTLSPESLQEGETLRLARMFPPPKQKGGKANLQQILFSFLHPLKFLRRDRIENLASEDPTDWVTGPTKDKVNMGVPVARLVKNENLYKKTTEFKAKTARAYTLSSELVPPGSFAVLPETYNEINAEYRKAYGKDLEPGDIINEKTLSFIIHRDPALSDGSSMGLYTFHGVMTLSAGDVNTSIVVNPQDKLWKEAAGDFDGDSGVVMLPDELTQPIETRKEAPLDFVKKGKEKKDAYSGGNTLLDNRRKIAAGNISEVERQNLIDSDPLNFAAMQKESGFGQMIGQIMSRAQQLQELGLGDTKIHVYDPSTGNTNEVSILYALAKVGQGSISAKKKAVWLKEALAVFDQAKNILDESKPELLHPVTLEKTVDKYEDGRIKKDRQGRPIYKKETSFSQDFRATRRAKVKPQRGKPNTKLKINAQQKNVAHATRVVQQLVALFTPLHNNPENIEQFAQAIEDVKTLLKNNGVANVDQLNQDQIVTEWNRLSEEEKVGTPRSMYHYISNLVANNEGFTNPKYPQFNELLSKRPIYTELALRSLAVDAPIKSLGILDEHKDFPSVFKQGARILLNGEATPGTHKAAEYTVRYEKLSNARDAIDEDQDPESFDDVMDQIAKLNREIRVAYLTHQVSAEELMTSGPPQVIARLVSKEDFNRMLDAVRNTPTAPFEMNTAGTLNGIPLAPSSIKDGIYKYDASDKTLTRLLGRDPETGEYIESNYKIQRAPAPTLASEDALSRVDMESFIEPRLTADGLIYVQRPSDWSPKKGTKSLELRYTPVTEDMLALKASPEEELTAFDKLGTAYDEGEITKHTYQSITLLNVDKNKLKARQPGDTFELTPRLYTDYSGKESTWSKEAGTALVSMKGDGVNYFLQIKAVNKKGNKATPTVTLLGTSKDDADKFLAQGLPEKALSPFEEAVNQRLASKAPEEVKTLWKELAASPHLHLRKGLERVLNDVALYESKQGGSRIKEPTDELKMLSELKKWALTRGIIGQATGSDQEALARLGNNLRKEELQTTANNLRTLLNVKAPITIVTAEEMYSSLKATGHDKAAKMILDYAQGHPGAMGMHSINETDGSHSIYVSGTLDEPTQAFVLAHEFGHAIATEGWDELNATNKPLAQEVSKDWQEFTKAKDKDVDDVDAFHEWLADNIGYWISSEEKPTTASGMWFASLAKKFIEAYKIVRRAFQNLLGEDNLPPALQSIENWMQSLAQPIKEIPTIRSPGVQTQRFADRAVQGQNRIANWAMNPAHPDIEALNEVVLTIQDDLNKLLGPEDAAMLRRVAFSPPMRQRLLQLLGKNTQAAEAIEQNPDAAVAYLFALATSGILRPTGEVQSVLSNMRETLRLINRKLLEATPDEVEEIINRLNLLQGTTKDPNVPLIPPDSPAARLYAERENRYKKGVFGAIQRTSQAYKKMFSWYIDEPYMRILNTGIPSLIAAARAIQPSAYELGGLQRAGLVERTRTNFQLYAQRAESIINGLNEKDQQILKDILYKVPNVKDVPTTVKEAEGKIRSLMEDLYNYIEQSGVKIQHREAYWPVVPNHDYIKNNIEEVLDIYSDSAFAEGWDKVRLDYANWIQKELANESEDTIKDALTDLAYMTPREFIKFYLINDGQRTLPNQIIKTLATNKLHNPGFRYANPRELNFLLNSGNETLHKEVLNTLNTDLNDVAQKYIRSTTKRAEHSLLLRRLGPKGMESLNQNAKAEGASEKDLQLFSDYMSAVQGMLGLKERDAIDNWVEARGPDSWFQRFHSKKGRVMNPELQRASALVLMWENISHLTTALAAASIDPLGQLARHGKPKIFMKTLAETREYFKNQAKGLPKSTLEGYVDLLGTMNHHLRRQDIESTYSAEGMHKGPAKIMDTFFKWNLVEPLTDWSRAMASFGAFHAIADWHKQALGTGREATIAQGRLRELGLMPEDIVLDDEGFVKVLNYDERAAAPVDEKERDLRIRVAIGRFVDQSTVRPDPTNRALLMSNPYYAIPMQWKAFIIAYNTNILRPAWSKLVEEGNATPLMWMALTTIPVMLFMDTIRDGVKMAFSDDKDKETGKEWRPTWKQNWTLEDHVLYSIRRAGFYGNDELTADVIDPLLNGKIPEAISELGGVTASDIRKTVQWGWDQAPYPGRDLVSNWG